MRNWAQKPKDLNDPDFPISYSAFLYKDLSLRRPRLIPVATLYPHTTILFIMLCVPLISVSLLAPTASAGFHLADRDNFSRTSFGRIRNTTRDLQHASEMARSPYPGFLLRPKRPKLRPKNLRDLTTRARDVVEISNRRFVFRGFMDGTAGYSCR